MTDQAAFFTIDPQLQSAPSRQRRGAFARIAASLRDRAKAHFWHKRNMNERKGFVWLVGAGPGDPELLTLKALHALEQADVVVVDRLVDPRIADLARLGSRRIYVGKVPGKASIAQDDINAILISEAAAGRVVVRLKGGDPFVFGRGGEEVAALDKAGIGSIVVPGITAAAACAAAARLPLTQREIVRSFSLVAGAVSDGPAHYGWQALARPGHACAIYMGVGAAGHIEQQLASHGIDPNTPVVIVENGTRADERIIETRAAALHAAIVGLGVTGPALIYVGLHWSQSGITPPGTVEVFSGDSVVALHWHNHVNGGTSQPRAMGVTQ